MCRACRGGTPLSRGESFQVKHIAFLLAALGAAVPAAAQDLAQIDPKLAEIPAIAAELLASDDPMARLSGALALCIPGTYDPQVAMDVLEGAGWNALEGEGGQIGYDFDGSFETLVTVDTVASFCMVQSLSMGTADLTGALLGVVEALELPDASMPGSTAEDCAILDTGLGIEAIVHGSDDGGTCLTEDPSEVRFTMPDV